MKREVIAEYTYTLPEFTDEEIIDFFEKEGITDVNPELIRMFINKSIHQLFCETIEKMKTMQ